jgi:hypothetical protein
MASEAAAEFVLTRTCKRPAANIVPNAIEPSGPKLHLSWGSSHNTTTPNKQQGHCDPACLTYSAKKLRKCENVSVVGDVDKATSQQEETTCFLSKASVEAPTIEEPARCETPDPPPCAGCGMHAYWCECSTLELNQMATTRELNQMALQLNYDDTATYDYPADITTEGNPNSSNEPLVITKMPFQLITGREMPFLAKNDSRAGCDHKWAVGVAGNLFKGLTCLIDKIGGWLKDDVESSLLMRLLQNHEYDVELLCREHQRYASHPINLPVFSRSSKVLVANGAARDDIMNRFSMKLDQRVDAQQYILKFQTSNKFGHTRQLCQFVLHYDQTQSMVEGLTRFPIYVRAHQAPVGAMLLLRGVMQVIDWYGCQNVLLSDDNIQVLLKKAKEIWAQMKAAGKHGFSF